MQKKFWYLLVLYVLPLSIIYAQEPKLTPTQNITISDGLAHNGITCLLEDAKGYLWIGTYDGLNKYDGYAIEAYKNTSEKKILASNRVRVLVSDNANNLWIGTDNGITIYNYEVKNFNTIYSNSKLKNINGPIIRNIIINKNQIICGTEQEGLIVFNNNYKLVGKYSPSNKISFLEGVKLDEQNILYTTNKGLLLFNLVNHSFTPVLENKIQLGNSIIKFEQNSLFIATEYGLLTVKYLLQNGVYQFNILAKNFEHYQFKTLALESKTLWLGTLDDGFLKVENITSLNQNNNNPKYTDFKLDKNVLRISKILITPEASWVATFNKGIYRFNLSPNPFKYFKINSKNENPIKVNFLNNVNSFGTSNAIISSNDGGLVLFNTEENKIKRLSDFYGESGSKISFYFLDSKGNIWVKYNSEKGFYRINIKTRKKEKILINEQILTDNFSVKTITEDKFGNVWLCIADGTYKCTINVFGEILKVENLNNIPAFKGVNLSKVRSIYQDPEYDFIWFGTHNEGLFRIDIAKNKSLQNASIKQFIHSDTDKKSISSNFITNIKRINNKELWIATEGGGICEVLNSNKTPEFIAYTEKQGLANDVVKSFQSDKDNNLWIATNIGLSKFSTQTKSFRNFSRKDGLPFEDFWYPSAQLSNGNFIFSGDDGFCYFNPIDILKEESIPLLHFGDLKVINQVVLPGDTVNGRVLLTKRLQNNSHLELNYDEDFFSIEINSIHYSNPKNHFIRYRLLPVSKNWIVIPSNQQFINYSGLKPGDYTIQVSASNALNQWSKIKQLKITINPPFWKTKLAYALYLILFGTALYIVIIVFLKIQSLKHKIELEQLEIDTEKRINTAKLRFFSNIAHEIKTPITLISGPVDSVLSKFKSGTEDFEKLELVLRQSKKISQLIDQVHDFQKGDANLLKVNNTYFQFDSFVKGVVTDFDFMSKSEGKKLEIKSQTAPIFVYADRDKLEKILNNLLSNAFKHTHINDIISVNYEAVDKNLILSVKDTGSGIHEDDLPFIFDRFYQSKFKHSIYSGGSGIGLAFTKLLVEMHYGYISVESIFGNSTQINIKLPVISNSISAAEISIENNILLKEEQYASIENLVIDKLSSIEVDSEFKGATIFLAEDNFEMRKYVSDVLKQYFEVKTFSNGEECLDALEEEWPDLIISDVLMPVINGFELCKKVKSDIKTNHIPIILLTACISLDEQLTGLSNGADAYIKKPFDIKELAVTIQSILRTRNQLNQHYQLGLPLKLEVDHTEENAFLEKLYSLMEDNLDNQDLDINNFARVLYLNRSFFYKKVKALTNQTPFELLKLYRLKRATQLLAQDKHTVNEVFMMTGFKSRPHFSSLFKEVYGVPPSKYLDSLK